MTQEEIATIFEEWKRQWDENPGGFDSDDVHKAAAPATYGERAAVTFLRIAEELGGIL